MIGGDFVQILPVVQRGTRASTVAAIIQKSDIWPYLCILFLKQNMRLSNDDESGIFARCLKEISYNLHWRNQIELPPFISQTQAMEEFCEAVFPRVELQNFAQNVTFFLRPSYFYVFE